jgi:hypothetical protein
MLYVDEEYLKELNYDNLPAERKAEMIADVEGAIIEKVLEKVQPLVPNLGEIFDEARSEVKKSILDFRALGSKIDQG